MWPNEEQPEERLPPPRAAWGRPVLPRLPGQGRGGGAGGGGFGGRFGRARDAGARRGQDPRVDAPDWPARRDGL